MRGKVSSGSKEKLFLELEDGRRQKQQETLGRSRKRRKGRCGWCRTIFSSIL